LKVVDIGDEEGFFNRGDSDGKRKLRDVPITDDIARSPGSDNRFPT